MSQEPVFNPTDSLRFELELGFGPFSDDSFSRETVRKVKEVYGDRIDIFKSQGEGKPFTGSNTFGLFAVDEIARPMGARVAHPPESELLLALGKMHEPGTYRDLGAVLDFSGNNHGMALRLHERLAREHQDLDMFPAILTDLATRLDDGSPRGLTLQPSDSYAYGITPAKILAGDKGSFRKDDPGLTMEGLPSKLGEGERTIYIRELHIAKQKGRSADNLGLSRLYLGSNLALVADDDGLAYSYSGGRVVLVKNQGADMQHYARLVEYVASLGEAKRHYIALLEALQSRIGAEITAHQKNNL